MAENAGLVSAIGDLAAEGYKLANAILSIVNDLGTFRAQVKAIARDTKAVGNTLRQIKARLVKASDVPSEVTTALAEVVALCAEDIDNITEALAPLLAQENRKGMLKQRLWWLLGKSKIMTRQASLDSLKLTLSLFVHTMDIMEDDTEAYVRDEVENLVANSRNIRITFLEAECVDRYMEREFEQFRTASPVAGSSQNREDVSEISTARNASNTSLELSAVELVASISDLGTTDDRIRDLARRHMSSHDEGFAGTELLASISEDHFLSIANHLRVRRSVSSLALVVARQEHSFKVTVLSENGDGPREPEPTHSARGSPPRASLSTTRSSVSKARSKFGEETPGQSSSAQVSEPPRSSASHTSHVESDDDDSDAGTNADTMGHGSDTTDDHSAQVTSRSSHDPADGFGVAHIYPGHALWPRHGSSSRFGAPDSLPPGFPPQLDSHSTPPQDYGFSDPDLARFREFQEWERDRDRRAKAGKETKAPERLSTQREAREQHDAGVDTAGERMQRHDERKRRQEGTKRQQKKDKVQHQEEAEIEEEEQNEAEEDPKTAGARKGDEKTSKKGLRKFFSNRKSRAPTSKPMVLPYQSLTL